MLPTPLCGMFSSKHATIVNLTYMPIDKKRFCITGYLINILFYFISNYNGRFLGASKTDSNCNGDICQGNTCQGNIVHVRHISAVTDQILTKL